MREEESRNDHQHTQITAHMKWVALKITEIGQIRQIRQWNQSRLVQPQSTQIHALRPYSNSSNNNSSTFKIIMSNGKSNQSTPLVPPLRDRKQSKQLTHHQRTLIHVRLEGGTTSEESGQLPPQSTSDPSSLSPHALPHTSFPLSEKNGLTRLTAVNHRLSRLSLQSSSITSKVQYNHSGV